jgi:hypothetical protein
MKLKIKLARELSYRFEFDVRDIERLTGKEYPQFLNWRTMIADRLVEEHLREIEPILVPWLTTTFGPKWKEWALDMKDERIFLRLRTKQQALFFKTVWG